MTARKTTTAPKATTQDVLPDTPADEVTEAIAELEAEANGKAPKAPAKKVSAKVKADTKAVVRTSHADCTHAKTGREGKAARAACRRERAAAEAKDAK